MIIIFDSIRLVPTIDYFGEDYKDDDLLLFRCKAKLTYLTYSSINLFGTSSSNSYKNSVGASVIFKLFYTISSITSVVFPSFYKRMKVIS